MPVLRGRRNRGRDELRAKVPGGGTKKLPRFLPKALIERFARSPVPRRHATSEEEDRARAEGLDASFPVPKTPILATFTDVSVGTGARVTLTVRGGERVLLVLPEVTQRRAVTRTLLGLEPNRGGLDVMGNAWPVDETALSGLLASSLAIVSPFVPLIESLTVEANVSLPGEFDGAPDRNRVEHVIRALSVAPLRKRMPPTLSAAESFRCRLARALVRRPALLVIDIAGVEIVEGMDSEPFYEALSSVVDRAGVLILDESARDTAWATRVVTPDMREAA